MLENFACQLLVFFPHFLFQLFGTHTSHIQTISLFSLTRKFLVENGYQFTGDQSKIIIPLEVEWNDIYGSDYEDFDTEVPAGQTISVSTNDA